MANTVNTAYAYLQAWSLTFKKDYAPGIADKLRRFGQTTRIMPLSKRALNGSAIEYEFKPYQNRSTHATRTLMDPMPDPGPGSYGRFIVNFDHTDPTNNDFMKLEIGFRTTWYDMKKRADSNFKDSIGFIDKDVQEGLDDVKESFARYLHLPADGLLATVNAKRNSNTDSYYSASAYTNGSTACILLLNDFSIARIGDGQNVEIRTAAGTLRANNLRVDYVHPDEKHIVVRVQTSGTNISVDASDAQVTNCDSFAATDKVYLSGNYNVSASGTLAGLFDPTLAYYGKARLTADGYRMLIPIRIDASQNGATVALTPEMIHRAGMAAGWSMGDGNSISRRSVVMARDQWMAISRFNKDTGITVVPGFQAGPLGEQYKRAFGFDGSIFHDPNLGPIMCVVDDFAAYGQIDFLNMDDWEMVVPFGDGGFEMLPGDTGFWTRNSENDGSGRPALVWSAQGMQLFAFVCTWPKGQTRLYGLASPVA